MQIDYEIGGVLDYQDYEYQLRISYPESYATHKPLSAGTVPSGRTEGSLHESNHVDSIIVLLGARTCSDNTDRRVSR
jgi:hypothetical protein